MGINPLSDKELRAFRFIRNVLVHEGRQPGTRDIAKATGHTSSRTGARIVQSLAAKGYLRRRENGALQLLRELSKTKTMEETILVPIVGTAPCGAPLLAEQNVEAHVRVSKRKARGDVRYFLLRAKGTSMEEAGIHSGDLMLVRAQPTADEGDTVVALLDDEATVKQFHRSGKQIILRPRSKDKQHKPILLDGEFQLQGVVVDTIPKGAAELLTGET